MPEIARRKGVSSRSVDIVSSGEEDDRPTKVPRRVCKCCEGERVTESKEYGLPSTSNVASVER
jgi:hypothetical protein